MMFGHLSSQVDDMLHVLYSLRFFFFGRGAKAAVVPRVSLFRSFSYSHFVPDTY